MALTTMLPRRHEKLLMIVAMAYITANCTINRFSIFPFYTKAPSDLQVSMRALLPILYDGRSLNGMTKNTFFILKNTFSLTARCPVVFGGINQGRKKKKNKKIIIYFKTTH